VRQFVVWEDLYRRIVLAKISIVINYLSGKHYRADHDGTSTSSDPSSTEILSNRHSPDARLFFGQDRASEQLRQRQFAVAASNE
jgi:hypothetical protein